MDALGLTEVRPGIMHSLSANQPNALQKIGEQERRRDELRRAKLVEMKKSSYQGQSECFTMFGTAMDNNRLPPPTEPSSLQATSDSAPVGSPAPPSRGEPRRESPFHDVFLGPGGMYVGTRWLIYLVMAGIVLAIEG